MSRQFFKCDTSLFHGGGLAALNPPARLVFVALQYHRNGSGFAWPSGETLASETGYNRATVIKALKELEDGGIIEKAKNRPPEMPAAARSVCYSIAPHEVLTTLTPEKLTRATPEPVRCQSHEHREANHVDTKYKDLEVEREKAAAGAREGEKPSPEPPPTPPAEPPDWNKTAAAWLRKFGIRPEQMGDVLALVNDDLDNLDLQLTNYFVEKERKEQRGQAIDDPKRWLCAAIRNRYGAKDLMLGPRAWETLIDAESDKAAALACSRKLARGRLEEIREASDQRAAAKREEMDPEELAAAQAKGADWMKKFAPRMYAELNPEEANPIHPKHVGDTPEAMQGTG